MKIDKRMFHIWSHTTNKRTNDGNAEDKEEVEKSSGNNRVHHHMHQIYFLHWLLFEKLFWNKSFYNYYFFTFCTHSHIHTCNSWVFGIYQQNPHTDLTGEIPFILEWFVLYMLKTFNAWEDSAAINKQAKPNLQKKRFSQVLWSTFLKFSFTQ